MAFGMLFLPVAAMAGEDDHDHGHGDHAHAVIGKPAPAFALKDVNGKEHKLADYKGKVVVLEWTNHQCPVVNFYHKKNATTKTFEMFKGKPVVWLAIDSSHFCADKTEEIKKWAEAGKLNYPILLDAPGVVGRQYSAKTTPHMFVIDQKGNLAYMGSFDDDNKMENKENARNYVAEAITSLLDGSTVAMATTKSFGCGVKYKKN